MDESNCKALRTELIGLNWSEEAIDLGINQNFKCCYCGRDLLASIEDYDVWQFDHIVPVSKNGADSTANKVIACKLCNFSKRNWNPQDVAGKEPSLEELQRFAKAHVTEQRQKKTAHLNKVKEVLLRYKLIDQGRFEKSSDPPAGEAN
jgi:CRISPR/Cas system Type II protein with McrA/HNH and RuvC-like nuclease domain